MEKKDYDFEIILKHQCSGYHNIKNINIIEQTIIN